MSVPPLYSDEWEYSRRITFRQTFIFTREPQKWYVREVKYLGAIDEKERFGQKKICVKLVRLDKITWFPLTQFSIDVTETSEMKDWAVAVYVVKSFAEKDIGQIECGEKDDPAHPAFKHAWVAVNTDLYNLPHGAEGEFIVEGYIDVWKEREKPPEEKPPEEKPPEKPPEKPEEPFDVAKWLEWALKNILRDKEPPTCTPHNTWLLVLLLTITYLNTLADIDWWISILGLTPIPTILFYEPWRIFTHMWLHYPITEVLEGWTIPHAHIAFNTLYLYVFGDNVECRLGYGKYIAYYIVCGITAGLGQVAWLHIIGLGFEPIIIIGASGAISGILGMYLVFFPDNTVVFLGKEMKAYWFIVLWFLGQVAMLFSLEITVGVAAHIVGFLTGVILAAAEKRVEEEIAQ